MKAEYTDSRLLHTPESLELVSSTSYVKGTALEAIWDCRTTMQLWHPCQQEL